MPLPLNKLQQPDYRAFQRDPPPPVQYARNAYLRRQALPCRSLGELAWSSDPRPFTQALRKFRDLAAQTKSSPVGGHARLLGKVRALGYYMNAGWPGAYPDRLSSGPEDTRWYLWANEMATTWRCHPR